MPIESSEWASPLAIVRRRTFGFVQIFVYLSIHFIDPNQHPILDPNELISRQSGCSVFSTLDLSQAYGPLPLSKESQKYCVISKHHGSFTYQR